MGKNNQPLMGSNLGEGGGGLALYGFHFSPCRPFTPSTSSVGLRFVYLPAFTGAARKGHSPRDSEVD